MMHRQSLIQISLDVQWITYSTFPTQGNSCCNIALINSCSASLSFDIAWLTQFCLEVMVSLCAVSASIVYRRHKRIVMYVTQIQTQAKWMYINLDQWDSLNRLLGLAAGCFPQHCSCPSPETTRESVSNRRLVCLAWSGKDHSSSPEWVNRIVESLLLTCSGVYVAFMVFMI